MFQKTFILISLFSFSFLMYFPLSKKEIDLNTDDICYYSEDANKIYVKACDKGYYCNKNTTLSPHFGICLENYSDLKKYKEECSQNSECYIGLQCSNEKHCINQNDKPYIYTDKASTKEYFYCPDNTFPKIEANSETKCTSTDKDKCFLTLDNKLVSSDYLKTCGEFSDDLQFVSTSDFGGVDDGKFVGDSLACKSGFALYFYENKEIHSNNSTTDPKYQLCVTIKGVAKYNNDTKCVIRYTNGSDIEYIYNPDDSKLYEENKFPYCDAIMTKIELIQEYFSKFDKLKPKCLEGNFYEEPFTCKNDELRKVWYYYNHIEEYLLYKNDQEVLDYLVEEAYPTPKTKDKEEEDKNKKDSSGFLDNKYFLLLLLLAI
jgi:hypothetical protein